jgi:hypothetical protein
MTRIIQFIATLAILLGGINCNAQKSSKTLDADSIFIYKNFNFHGSTSNLWSNHSNLDSIKSKRELITNPELEELKGITSRAKNKKLIQQKYGGSICYMVISKELKEKRFVVTFGSDWIGIDDLTNMRRWIISEPSDIKELEKIINKYWL